MNKLNLINNLFYASESLEIEYLSNHTGIKIHNINIKILINNKNILK